ncbi:MAG: MerR family transcriptional regulator [Naasia sp.]|jgi:DNA-binding transcriptional MerR regulator|uniref:transcriptional regulator FtsR n=1 Tax=Naasia sp. TaxID=2546198 RepID=UPI0026295C8C|nr:MerR family transcriptional regulator [Naasia sp.]MCU1569305.1 MerR family transcriptional regulator [Naasia sp.]
MSTSLARMQGSAAPASLLNIGQVLAKLKPEFPDLSPSKLRFLEEQRLVFPARTESGYRKFSSRDLDRLRLILTMQRDHYLPLKVIRTYLADLEAGKNPAWPGATAQAPPSMLGTERRYTREELLREAGAPVTLLDEAVSASILPPGEVYGDESLGVLRALTELRRVGIEPRHLRGFRAAAEREAALLESAVLPAIKRRDGASRARGAELALELAAQLDVVRASLIRGSLDRLGS